MITGLPHKYTSLGANSKKGTCLCSSSNYKVFSFSKMLTLKAHRKRAGTKN